MLKVLGVVVLVVVLLVVLLETLGRRPSYYRRRPAKFVEEFARAFASCPEGSVLVMAHMASDRKLELRKLEDTGTQEQRAIFSLPRFGWARPYFESVREALEVGGFPLRVSWKEDREGWLETLEVPIEGEHYTFSREARRVLEAVLPAVGLGPEDRFTFHVDATGFDLELQARVEQDMWKYVAATADNRLARRIAEGRLALIKKRRKDRATDTRPGASGGAGHSA